MVEGLILQTGTFQVFKKLKLDQRIPLLTHQPQTTTRRHKTINVTQTFCENLFHCSDKKMMGGLKLA